MLYGVAGVESSNKLYIYTQYTAIKKKYLPTIIITESGQKILWRKAEF